MKDFSIWLCGIFTGVVIMCYGFQHLKDELFQKCINQECTLTVDGVKFDLKAQETK